MQCGPPWLLVLCQQVCMFTVQEPLKQVTLTQRGSEVQRCASKLVPQGSCIVTVDRQVAPQTPLWTAGQSGYHFLGVPYRTALWCAVWDSQTHFSFTLKLSHNPRVIQNTHKLVLKCLKRSTNQFIKQLQYIKENKTEKNGGYVQRCCEFRALELCMCWGSTAP